MKFLLLAVVSLCLKFGATVSLTSCELSIENKEEVKKFRRGSSFSATCSFTANCPVDIHIYRSDGSINLPITDFYWYIVSGLRYEESSKEIEKNKRYEVKMLINYVRSNYIGDYYCVIKDRSNSTNTKNKTLVELIIQHDDADSEIITPCFAPSADNITIIPTYYANGSVSVTLDWQPSIKEDSNTVYCTGSRRWKVRLQSFPNVSMTPADGEVRESIIPWIKVNGRDTFHTFTQLLDNYTYYQFHIENRPEEPEYKRAFGSHIYYFGKQTIPNIINQQKSTFKINELSSISIQCTATGNPAPSVKWFSSISGSVDQDIRGVLYLNNVTSSQKGEYYCIANNVMVNPPLGKREVSSLWKVTVDVEAYKSSNGVLCDRAFSTSQLHCDHYLHTHFPIYTNISSREDRNKLTGIMMTHINEYVKFGKCRDLAYSILCHTIYPYCDVSQSIIPKPRTICNDSCNQFIHSMECSQYAAKMKLENEDLYKLLMSRCDTSHRSGGDGPECIPLSIHASKNDQTEPIVDTGSCMKGNGRGYSGNQIRTTTNNLCQVWSVQSPHAHPMLPSIYTSELVNAGYSCRNPGGLGERPWCYTNYKYMRWEYCDIPQCDTCVKYNGTICANIDGYRSSQVWVRRGKVVNSWKDIEAKIMHGITGNRFHHRPSKGCEKLFQVLLCHSSLPTCTNGKPLPLCNNHCKLRKSLEDLCPDSYTEYVKFVKENSNFISIFNCSECGKEVLPIPQLNNNEESKQANVTDDCYTDTGKTYRGNVSVTATNLRCVPWDSSNHIVTSSQYPELIGANNYCRNPGELQSRPWCYTNSTSKPWDYCNIVVCGTQVIPNAVDPLDDAIVNSGPRSQATALIYTFSITLAIFVIAIICAVSVMILLRRRRRMLKMKKNLLEKAPNVMQDDKFVANPDYNRINPITSGDSRIPENFCMLETKQIKYISQLGQGNFGIVFKGRAFNITSDQEEMDVAVKTLKEETSSEIIQDFIDEAKLLFTFDHPNILTIYGVCMTEMPYQMVFEYMDEGDLTQFLRMRASSTQRRLLNAFNYRSRTESSFSNDPPSLSKTQLLHICNQIASGMKYLSEKNHIHRDLACRNCLVRSDLTVKIGDFGMSRNLYSKDYYRINGHAVLPVRWMSPESLIYGKFSIEGDVWSFGIVMWEVFSFALQPYYGISNEEVTEAIRHGKMLHRPDDCPTEVYKIMKECWNMDPMERPTFEELYTELSHHYESATKYDQVEDDLDDNLDLMSYDSDAFYSEDTLSMDSASRNEDDI